MKKKCDLEHTKIQEKQLSIIADKNSQKRDPKRTKKFENGT